MNQFTIEQDANQCRVALADELTASTVPDLQAALKTEVEHGAMTVVFDLARTVMLDSSGIGLMIATCNSLARKQGLVRVQNAAPEILQLLQSMRLVSRLNVTGRETSQT